MGENQMVKLELGRAMAVKLYAALLATRESVPEKTEVAVDDVILQLEEGLDLE